MEDNKLITIGKISKNQGNKGEVRVLPFTDFPERFQLLEKVILLKDDKVMEKKIQSLRYHKKFVIIKFEGIENIGQALELKNYYIKIPEEDLLPLEEEEYYIDDLLGYQVITSSGDIIGNVTEVVTTGGTDIFFVKGNKKEYMIPAAREIILEIDEKEGKMKIDPIPGLLDL